MSLTAFCGWSFVRSAVLALGAVGISNRLAAGMKAARFRWTLLLAPFLVPHLFVGYAYSRLALSLLHHPVWNEAAYCLLLFFKFFPAAVVVHIFAPLSPISAEAIYCQRLLRRADGRPRPVRLFREAAVWIFGPGRASIAAFSMVFLLAFQEFEIASLMGITAGETHSPISWTVWLFDAHAGGLPLSHSLRYALAPLCFELAVVLPALVILPGWMTGEWPSPNSVSSSRRSRRLGTGLILLAAVCLAGIPSLVVIRGMAKGFASLYTNFPVVRQIVAGGAIALGATVIACTLARRSLAAGSNRRRRWTAAALSLPGLLGPLVLSLMILGLFQLPGLRILSQSLVPLILALVLFVLPRTLVVFAVTGSSRRTQAAQCARMLAQSPSAARRLSAARLVDDLEAKGIFWSAVLVWYWAYWEMTPPAMLAPPSVMPFSVLLYNFLHYGQNAVLSTMLAATVFVPAAAIVGLALMRPILIRWILR